MLMEVICFTVSDGECKSMTRLWMRISKRSHVLVPSPHGDLWVMMRKVFVGMRTGPLQRSRLSLAPLIRSAHFLQSLNFARSEENADLVNARLLTLECLGG